MYNPTAFAAPVAARQERRRFPLAAVREAVVNAICHRDYTIKGSPILIELFADRLAITSPGGLPNTQTLEMVKLGLVYQRNPLLVRYLYDFRYGFPPSGRLFIRAASKKPEAMTSAAVMAKLRFWPTFRPMVAIPITVPSRRMTGPPLLPGLIGAEI